jgi:beta-mannan synthase
VVPALQLAVYVCAAMSLMLFLERMYMAIVVAGLWLRRRRPKRPSRRGVVALAADDDMEAATDRFPMVLIQIPMFNEKQVRMIPRILPSSLPHPSGEIRAAGRGDC